MGASAMRATGAPPLVLGWDRGVRMIFGVRWTAHTRYGALRKGIKHMLAPSSILFAFGLSGERFSSVAWGILCRSFTMLVMHVLLMALLVPEAATYTVADNSAYKLCLLNPSSCTL
jgi:hypothetical protein